MSVRIHQLSKDIGMENKELIALLKSRGYEVKRFFFSICISAIFLSFVKPFHGCYNFNNNQEIFLSNTI